MTLLEIFDKFSREYEFDVSLIRGWLYIKRNLFVNSEYDVEIKIGNSGGSFFTRSYALKNGICIWGRGADILHKSLGENSQFTRAAINLAGDSFARIELSKGVLLIRLGPSGFSGFDSDTSAIRLFFSDAAKVADGFVEAAKNHQPTQDFTNLTKFRLGPRAWRNSMMLIFILTLFLFIIFRS
ncbi:hypothetical protein [Burkholderia sp. Ac-20379]|uniref:hypothetical protein n=1 Tax=Burkholderia sp. Ac-20379 TaxID=2703900 RepID=UPI001981CD49|nr:hypothetical protein [Burkholderia sp. Ac-20379]MBN3727002.1 hypothetical protein [Burkholderia sp. Ac-20379]